MEVVLKYFDDFTPTQLTQLGQLYDLYVCWNEQINVISRKDIEELYTRHVLHSVSIAALCSFPDGCSILDIGTGGGFPGIPLALFFPNVRFTLVDSIGKKIKVAEAVAQSVGLQNVRALNARAETLPYNNYDFVVSRAVAPLSDLWRWARPLLRKGRLLDDFANGLFCLKGGDLRQEIEDSGLKPHLFSISAYFEEDYFQEKYIVYVPK